MSTLDRFHDESEHRLPSPARFILDSEGVTNADVAFGIAFASAKGVPGLKEQVTSSEVMSALLQSSNVRYAVIRLSSVKGSHERLVLAYPNEETLRGLIAEMSIVGLGFSSRDEAACAAGAAVTKGATPCQADGVAGSHAEERRVQRVRDQLAHRTKFSPIRRLATTIVQLGTAAAIFIFYSKNIVSATVREILAGSV